MKSSNLAILGALTLATTFNPKEASSQETAQTFNNRLTVKEAPHLRDDLVSPPPKNAIEAKQAELARKVASCVLLKGEKWDKGRSGGGDWAHWDFLDERGHRYDWRAFNGNNDEFNSAAVLELDAIGLNSEFNFPPTPQLDAISYDELSLTIYSTPNPNPTIAEIIFSWNIPFPVLNGIGGSPGGESQADYIKALKKALEKCTDDKIS